MAFFTVARAIFVRLLFAVHGLISVWRLHLATGDARYWYIITALLLMVVETVITIYKKRGNEWKWFCPSVFLYLLCEVPAIWFLELSELEKRINLSLNISSNETMEGLTANIQSLGFEIRIPVRLTSDQWVRTLEQILLLFLIVGRWMLPKGKLTHDQLSQLLLVYIGTAADIVEFFEAFKEEKVRYNRLLCKVILAIWSWSLIQFAMVLTATKARKDQSGLVSKKFPPPEDESCCTPDVYGIIISIFLQDAPFLVLRLLLIFKYGVLSYTNMFFTCKNTLVIMLLLYRLVVVQWERRTQRMKSTEYMNMGSESSSRVRLVPNSYSVDTYYSLVNKSKVNLKELAENTTRTDDIEEVPNVNYVIKRHYSLDKLKDNDEDDDDDEDDEDTSTEMKALQECFDLESEYDMDARGEVEEDTLAEVVCDTNKQDEDVFKLAEDEKDVKIGNGPGCAKLYMSYESVNEKLQQAETQSPVCGAKSPRRDKSSVSESLYDNSTDVKL